MNNLVCNVVTVYYAFYRLTLFSRREILTDALCILAIKELSGN